MIYKILSDRDLADIYTGANYGAQRKQTLEHFIYCYRILSPTPQYARPGDEFVSYDRPTPSFPNVV